MDPLSITAGVVGLSHSVLKAVANIKELDKKIWSKGMVTPQVTAMLEEIEVCEKVLEETGQKALTIRQELPASASSCLRLCQSNSTAVLASLEKFVKDRDRPLKKPIPQDLREQLDHLYRSIMMFRSVIMDSIIETLLDGQRQSRSVSMNGAVEVFIDEESEKSKETIETVLAGLSGHTVNGSVQIYAIPRSSSAQTGDDYIERLRQLRQALASQADTTGLEGRVRDTWTVEAVVVSLSSTESSSSPLIPVTVKIDTQSKANWVSHVVLQRLGSLANVEALESEYSVEAFGGCGVTAKRKVKLSWYSIGVGRTRDTEFFVNEEFDGFDLIVGQEFLNAEGFGPLWGESVLTIKENNLTPAQYVAMEANILENDRKSAELANVRRAKEDAKREEKRKKLAASRAASKAASRMGSVVPTPALLTHSPAVTSRRSSLTQINADGAPSSVQFPGLVAVQSISNAAPVSQVDSEDLEARPGD